MRTDFILNGKSVQAEHKPGETALEILRRIEVYSVKRGCDYGECGSCTILLDGKAVNACLILGHQLADKKIETVESFGSTFSLHPLQEKFLDEGAVQCGYCTPGMILSAEALLRNEPNPSDKQIRDALAGNLCRCTGYVKPVKAVHS